MRRFEPEAMGPPRQRETLVHGRTRVTTPDGRIFTVEQLTDPLDPRVDESQRLIQAFDPSAVDSVETIRTALRGVAVGDEDSPDIPLLVHVIEDRHGLVVGTAHSAVLPFRYARDWDSETDGFMLDAYEFIKPEARGLGLGAELWRQRLIDAGTHAEERGLELTAIAAEAPAGTEDYLNQIGLNRCYVQGQDGRLHELPYRQLVLADDWDKQTGQPREGKRPVPFHLMVGWLDQLAVKSITELRGIIQAIVGYDSEQTEGYFKSRLAYEVHRGVLERDLAECLAALNEAREDLFLALSADDRERWRAEHGPESVVEHRVEG